MKKSLGILLTLMLGSTYLVAGEINCKTEGNRLDCRDKNPFSENEYTLNSYKLSSIVKATYREKDRTYLVTIPMGPKLALKKISKSDYNKVMDYLEDSN